MSSASKASVYVANNNFECKFSINGSDYNRYFNQAKEEVTKSKMF